jgi:hypothetical protein
MTIPRGSRTSFGFVVWLAGDILEVIDILLVKCWLKIALLLSTVFPNWTGADGAPITGC